jgi:hypothetical protein
MEGIFYVCRKRVAGWKHFARSGGDVDFLE